MVADGTKEVAQSSEERIPVCFLALIIYGVARKPYRAADGRDVPLLKAPLPAEERRSARKYSRYLVTKAPALLCDPNIPAAQSNWNGMQENEHGVLVSCPVIQKETGLLLVQRLDKVGPRT